MGAWSGDSASAMAMFACNRGSALRGAAEVLGYSVLRSEQADAIEKFVSGRNVFVSLPTGSGKNFHR